MVDPNSHIYVYEGGHSALAALLPAMVPSHQEVIEPVDLRASIRRGPKAELLWLENTHSRGGGRASPVDFPAALLEIVGHPG